MKYSIIIPFHNEEQELELLLKGLILNLENRDPFEVILVDDFSSDGSVEIINQWIGYLPHGQLIRLGENKGPAFARNKGSRTARGKYLIFIDADTLPESNWSEMIVRHLDQEPAPGMPPYKIWGGRIKPLYDNHSVFQRMAAKVVSHKPRFDEKETPFDFPSGHLIVEKTLFEEMRGFNETLKIGEDTDFCFRVTQKEYALKYIPEAVVYHRVPRSCPQMLRRQFGYGKGFARNLKKYSRFSFKPLLRGGIQGSLFSYMAFLALVPVMLLWPGPPLLVLIPLVLYSLLLFALMNKNMNIPGQAGIKDRVLLFFIFHSRSLAYQLGYLRGYFR